MVKAKDNSRELARALDCVMREKSKIPHDFIPVAVRGMENICDKCLTHRDKGAHNGY